MSEHDDQPRFREKLDIGQVFMRQLDRVNLMVGLPEYNEQVLQLRELLPPKWREWTYANSEKYIIPKRKYIIKKRHGIPMGSLTDPFLKDKSKQVKLLEDGTIDWDDDNILSPTRVNIEEVEYTSMFAVIMQAAHYAGLTWQADHTNSERG